MGGRAKSSLKNGPNKAAYLRRGKPVSVAGDPSHSLGHERLVEALRLLGLVKRHHLKSIQEKNNRSCCKVARSGWLGRARTAPHRMADEISLEPSCSNARRIVIPMPSSTAREERGGAHMKKERVFSARKTESPFAQLPHGKPWRIAVSICTREGCLQGTTTKGSPGGLPRPGRGRGPEVPSPIPAS